MYSFRLLMFLLTISLIACNKDDDSSCTQADWIGSYEGIAICDGVTDSTTVRIIASGDNDIVISYETSTVATTYDPTTPNECSIEINGSTSGITTDTDISLDGDNLTISETLSNSLFSSNCEITATRQ